MSALTLDFILALRQNSEGKELPPLIAQLLGLDAAAYVREVSALLGMPGFVRADLEKLTLRYDILGFTDAASRLCVVAEHPQGGYWFIVADPFDPLIRNWAMQHLGVPFSMAFAFHDDLRNFFTELETSHRAMDQLAVSEAGEASTDGIPEISLASLAKDSNPVVKLVNSTLYDALKSKASDIHMESTPQGLTIKYRIDGVILGAGGANGVETAEQVISRLKVLADLDISEHRIPQDGRFKVLLNGREVDFRVSIMPSIHGEDAVLRILDKQSTSNSFTKLQLDILGHEQSTMAAIRSLAREPYGLLLVTGPTGSGKSTTLYATLSEINTGDEKIITIEDPVEYQLPGILQIPVNDKKGLTFARGLRSILRHDPDKILVGEIRDGETANIAVQAALTGHLVLTSVHANSVFSVLDRFMHMGVEPNSFVDALIGAVAQRLIRKICPHCITDDYPTNELLEQSGLYPADVRGWTFRKGAGCNHCRNTGYLGRKAIAEVLRLNDELREAIASRAPAVQVKQMAVQSGFQSIRQVALLSVARGETTLQEVNRVTFVD
ncbi:GspE/PulE family protein [Chitinilyticum litopenaei]|uniref:GspE/PulE family protein n=1 Tax=Chitinilyticum litopenaei TaxID=1121276 RepID=UPI000400BDF4|nr:GspE/PulE family protein [Chitinilyticum litopenaei]